MPDYALAILPAGWVLWMAPFLLMKRAGAPAKLDRRARWGILLEGLGFACVWFGPFWTRHPEAWRIALAAPFFLLGSLLSWTAARALGRHWRIDAGLNQDHELVRTGPYRMVRHPIYASMLSMLIATGLAIALWPLFAVGVVLFVIGTEIRVGIEDALLLSRFGDQFRDYQRSVAAYIPWVR